MHSYIKYNCGFKKLSNKYNCNFTVNRNHINKVTKQGYVLILLTLNLPLVLSVADLEGFLRFLTPFEILGYLLKSS